MEGVLRALHESGAGIYVGAEYLGSPTVADDVMLADQKPTGLQTLLHVAKDETDDRRYSIHPVKSETSAATKALRVPCCLETSDAIRRSTNSPESREKPKALRCRRNQQQDLHSS